MDAHPTGTAAVSWANGRIDTFWVDTDRSLIHRAFADGAWLEPESLGGALASAPTATAWAVDELQVFAHLRRRRALESLLGRHELASVGVARRRPHRIAGRVVLGRGPDRRVRPGSRRDALASLVGRDPLGRMGAAPALTLRPRRRETVTPIGT